MTSQDRADLAHYIDCAGRHRRYAAADLAEGFESAARTEIRTVRRALELARAVRLGLPDPWLA